MQAVLQQANLAAGAAKRLNTVRAGDDQQRARAVLGAEPGNVDCKGLPGRTHFAMMDVGGNFSPGRTCCLQEQPPSLGI